MIDVASEERCRRILDRADAVAEMDRRRSEALRDPDSVEERLADIEEN